MISLLFVAVNSALLGHALFYSYKLFWDGIYCTSSCSIKCTLIFKVYAAGSLQQRLVFLDQLAKMLANCDKLILAVLALKGLLPVVLSSHFRGGVITVRPTGIKVQVSYSM